MVADPVAMVEAGTGFALSPTQRALLRLAEGVRVEDLAGPERSAAQQAVGFAEGPTQPPRALLMNCGARSGKTMIAAYAATRRAIRCDLSGLAPGETCRVAFVSASMRQARAGLGYARGLVTALGLGRAVHGNRRDSFTLRRDGRDVEFLVVRGNVGGDALAGFWYAAVVVHEAAIATDPSANGVAIDLDAIERAVRPRLLPARGELPGGVLIEETTSRDAVGPAFDRVNDHHGKAAAPTLVFRATTLQMRPDDPVLQEHVERERASDALNAAREFDCEWIAAGSGQVFGSDVLSGCVDALIGVNLTPEQDLAAWAGVDLAFSGDGSALAIVRKRPAGDFELCALRRWRPGRRAPLLPSQVISEILDELQRHACHAVWCDVHHREALQEQAQARGGIRVRPAPAGAAGKHLVHADAQELFTCGQFRMGRDAKLLRSLQRITATRTDSGEYRIRSPRTRGDHGDDAAALVLALHGAYRRAGRGGDPPLRVGRVRSALIAMGEAPYDRSERGYRTEIRIDENGRAVRHRTRAPRWAMESERVDWSRF